MRRFLNRSTKTSFSISSALWSFKCDDLLIHIAQASYCWKVWSLSLHWKKINVMWPKLIVNETNEILKIFNFFQKKTIFFQILKIPWKTAPGAVFFEKLTQLQNHTESFQNIFRSYWRYHWKGMASHSMILRL